MRGKWRRNKAEERLVTPVQRGDIKGNMPKVMRVRLFDLMLGAIDFGFATIGGDMDHISGSP